MKTELSPRDWQEISAYVDQQLSPKAKIRLEARLQQEPALRTALEDLHSLQGVLRSQPRLRARRNFTLTPEMAGLRQKAAPYPIFRFAAALATILLVVLVVGDFISQRAVPTAQPMLMEYTEQMDAAAIEAPPEASEEPAAFAKIAPPAEETPPPASQFAPAPAASERGILPQETPAPTSEAPQPAAEAPGEGFQAFQLDQPPEILETGPNMFAQELAQPRIFGIDRRIWRGFEVLLGLIAILAGLAWWLTRQRS